MKTILARLSLALTVIAIQSGETWNFQAWFRDSNPTATSNFTDGLEIQFN